jgi:hypothetical protein
MEEKGCDSAMGMEMMKKMMEGQDGFMLRMMEACGIEVFKIARHNGFDIDARKETHGRWNYFALVRLE